MSYGMEWSMELCIVAWNRIWNVVWNCNIAWNRVRTL